MWERSAIVAVGDEVLTGEVINTNAAWLATTLVRAGSRPVWQAVVGDNHAAIQATLRTALEVADLVVLVGGLGPTPDDLTRDAVAAHFGLSQYTDEHVADAIRARHRRTPGHEASIRQQSQHLEGAELLTNRVGTAPGQLVHVGSAAVALLPGPPAECRAVAEELLTRVRLGTERQILRRTWRCYDLTESELAHHLGYLFGQDDPVAGIYTRPGLVELRLETPNGPGAVERLEDLMAGARIRAGVPLYGEEQHASEASRLVAGLFQAGATVAVAESLTGGLLTAQLTAVPGASKVVMEGAVVYTDAAKLRLGCPDVILATAGAVSRECAEALAEAALRRTGADFGVGLTGYAGPGGGTTQDPVGTYYCAVVGPTGRSVRRRSTRSGRESVRLGACESARFLLAAGLDGNWDTREQR